MPLIFLPAGNWIVYQVLSAPRSFPEPGMFWPHVQTCLYKHSFFHSPFSARGGNTQYLSQHFKRTVFLFLSLLQQTFLKWLQVRSSASTLCMSSGCHFLRDGAQNLQTFIQILLYFEYVIRTYILDQETYNVPSYFPSLYPDFSFKIVFPVSKHIIVSFTHGMLPRTFNRYKDCCISQISPFLKDSF